MHALVTNESALERDLISLALKRAGFETHLANNALETVEYLKNAQVDLLILDVLLPFGNGLDLLRYLRTSGLLSKTTAFIISELAYPGIVHQAAEAGAKAFLVKPIDSERLIERVLQAFPAVAVS